MQQKVQFISTVAHEPDLLILDEPVSGLDPVNAKAMEDEILRLKEKGKTVIFSTHRLEQVEELCDSLALIHRGQVLLKGSVEEVRNQFQKNQYRIVFEGEGANVEMIQGVTILSVKGNQMMVALDAEVSPKQILRQLSDAPFEIQKFEKAIPKLNDIFIELVGAAQEVPV
jgi:ABC-2 type transport system ATP-binding protein